MTEVPATTAKPVLVGTPLTGRRLIISAFEAYSPDRVVSLAQAMFFELATSRHGYISDLEHLREDLRAPALADDTDASQAPPPSAPLRPIAQVRDFCARFEPASHPYLYLSCVEAELRACVAQMMEAHREREEIVDNANQAYDHAVATLLLKGPLVKRFMASFWPLLLRFGVLSLLSAASIVLVKSNAAAGVAADINKNAGLLSIALGVLLTLVIGYGQDQMRNFRVVSLGRTRDQAMLDADKEEAIRIHDACYELYRAVERGWIDHAPASAFKADHPGTLRVLRGNLERIRHKTLPRTPFDVVKDGGRKLWNDLLGRLPGVRPRSVDA